MDAASVSPLALDDAAAALYPTRADTPEHADSLPRFVSDFAEDVRAASAEAAAAARRGEPPPPALWPRVHGAFCDMFRRYAAAPSPVFHSADPLRRAVGRHLLELGAAPPAAHAELSRRLLFCAYWCCLGHALACTRPELYERACVRFFEARLGIGETPPADAERYWTALLELAGADPELFPRHAAAAAYLRARGRRAPLPPPPLARRPRGGDSAALRETPI
ncbi:virion protein US10 [Equid herpesvirus 6]|uniref:Virion protein US10 homolog n=1 Tax=Equid herpesvirus 6 TaxID=173566 RepID=A0A7S9YUT0_9ALPH|nr:virion protein US10 [Equid herpesvirus 6]YP_010801477.1 virion protein US10 [Equid herpesvirus 6]QPI70176.1 virion protein US10 [Equid herpesvirus 6]QPI70188.1 virion protein US10 [Equid herpesvirus 6]